MDVEMAKECMVTHKKAFESWEEGGSRKTGTAEGRKASEGGGRDKPADFQLGAGKIGGVR